jgi:hypothetical protein
MRNKINIEIWGYFVNITFHNVTILSVIKIALGNYIIKPF